MATGRVAKIDAQRTAMGSELLDVKYPQSMPARETVHRHQRKVREVLMVNRVELIFLDKPLEMREFECDHPLRRQQLRHSRSEVVEIGDLRQHVVADDEIGPTLPRREPPGEVQSEELNQRWNVLSAGGLGYI